MYDRDQENIESRYALSCYRPLGSYPNAYTQQKYLPVKRIGFCLFREPENGDGQEVLVLHMMPDILSDNEYDVESLIQNIQKVLHKDPVAQDCYGTAMVDGMLNSRRIFSGQRLRDVYKQIVDASGQYDQDIDCADVQQEAIRIVTKEIGEIESKNLQQAFENAVGYPYVQNAARVLSASNHNIDVYADEKTNLFIYGDDLNLALEKLYITRFISLDDVQNLQSALAGDRQIKPLDPATDTQIENAKNYLERMVSEHCHWRKHDL